MSKSENQKMKPLVLLDILRMYSDEENPLSTNDIIRMLAERGIDTGRKAFYDDIRMLNEFGYEILTLKSRSNLYYVVDRKFDAAELRILIDAVASADFITERKTKELTGKLASLAGSNRGKLLTKNIVYTDTVKHTNEKVYYAVDALDRAILSGKKVEFSYFDLDCHGQRAYRKNGEKYVVNPVSLIFNDNKYYLTCYNDKYKNLSNYRIDKMDGVKTLDDDITPADCVADFDANKHRKQAFSMYIGEPEKVTFVVDKNALDVVFDKFGEKMKFSYYERADSGKYKFSACVQISPSFFAWCAQLGTRLKIISPNGVAESYKAYLNDIIDNYN